MSIERIASVFTSEIDNNNRLMHFLFHQGSYYPFMLNVECRILMLKQVGEVRGFCEFIQHIKLQKKV